MIETPSTTEGDNREAVRRRTADCYASRIKRAAELLREAQRELYGAGHAGSAPHHRAALQDGRAVELMARYLERRA